MPENTRYKEGRKEGRVILIIPGHVIIIFCFSKTKTI